MIAQLNPRLDEVHYAFICITPDTAPMVLGAVIGTFREDEGVSAIVPYELAREPGCDGVGEFAHIILQVHSALEGVGLTAAVAGALAESGIACNMVAALHHDHVFVPADRAHEALALLHRLSEDAGR